MSKPSEDTGLSIRPITANIERSRNELSPLSPAQEQIHEENVIVNFRPLVFGVVCDTTLLDNQNGHRGPPCYSTQDIKDLGSDQLLPRILQHLYFDVEFPSFSTRIHVISSFLGLRDGFEKILEPSTSLVLK